jgi:serine/threonine protein kinase
VHGDIKPENVLVFKEKSGRYSARVIDFGYSTRYINDKQQLALPISEPWNAPENNGRQRWWTPSQAVNADLFCFGMLCLWLLFENGFSGTTPLHRGPKVADIEFPRPTEDNLRRKKGKLPTYARQCLVLEITMEHDKKTALEEFFDSSLNQDPQERELSLSRLLKKLDPQG